MLVLIPLPDRDFDVTEVSVPWHVLTSAGHSVVFATEKGGSAPAADPLLLTGVLFGQLGADPEPKQFYEAMISSTEFNSPVAWSDIQPRDYAGLILPGGHAKGMRQYLASELLHTKVAEFFSLGRPVGAICHGVLVLARAKDAHTGRSPIATKKTTCLPKYMERTAYFLTRWKLGDYYRTYPEYVEDEVKRALQDSATQFVLGPRTLMKRGSASDDSGAFVVKDGSYLSARWPGDAYLFARTFDEMLRLSKTQ